MLSQLLSARVRVQIVESTHFKWEPNKLPLADHLVEARNQYRPLHDLNRPKDSRKAIRVVRIGIFWPMLLNKGMSRS
jgi:hypothetical protein